jgi:hypothetical protein
MDDTSTQLKSSDHVVSVHRVNRPAQYPAQWSVSEFGTKYQAPNMESEALNIANYDTLHNSLASGKLRYRYDELKTADSDQDKPQSSEETRSKISGSDNPEGISDSSYQNLQWHRKSSKKYPTIRGQQNTHFSSGDHHYPEKFPKLTRTANRVGTDPIMRKAIPLHTDSLGVRKEGVNHQGTADKVKGNSLRSMKPIRHQTKDPFESGHGPGRSKISGFDNPEGISDSSHQNLQWHRKSSKKYPTIRGQQNTHFSSGDHHYPEKFPKLTQTANRVGTDPRMRKTIPLHTDSLGVRKGVNHQGTADKVKGNSLHSMKPIRHQTKYPFKSGHGQVGSNAVKFGDTIEREKRNDEYIHSRIEALKANAKRDIDKETTTRSESREINRKVQQSPSYYNDADNIKQHLQTLHHKHKASALHGEGGDMAFPKVLMNAKTAIINIQEGKNEDSVSINNSVASLIGIVQKNTNLYFAY